MSVNANLLDTMYACTSSYDLATVLIAYALEPKDDAISEADRLLAYWEAQEAPTPTLHIVRVNTPRQ